MAELGDVVTLDDSGIGISEQIDVSTVYVEGSAIGRGDDMVLRDRRSMSEDGLVTVAIAIDWELGKVLSGPKVASRGFSVFAADPELELGVTDAVVSALGEHLASGNRAGADRAIREAANRYIFSKTRRRPVIMPMILNA
jgi:ribonuclease J